MAQSTIESLENNAAEKTRQEVMQEIVDLSESIVSTSMAAHQQSSLPTEGVARAGRTSIRILPSAHRSSDRATMGQCHSTVAYCLGCYSNLRKTDPSLEALTIQRVVD